MYNDVVSGIFLIMHDSRIKEIHKNKNNNTTHIILAIQKSIY